MSDTRIQSTQQPILDGLVFCVSCRARGLDIPLFSSRDAKGEIVYTCAGCDQTHRPVSQSVLLSLWHEEMQAVQLDAPHIRRLGSISARREHLVEPIQGGQMLSLVEDAIELFELAEPPDQRVLLLFVSQRADWDGRRLEVTWKPPFSQVAGAPAGPARRAAADGLGRSMALLLDAQQETATATLAALERIATAMERIAPPPTWLTRDQAAEHLQISLDTLKRIVKENGHIEGGPVDFGHGRKLLRFHSATIDDWYLEAGRPAMVAPIKAKRRRPRKRKPAEAATQTPVDWSKV